MKYSRELWQKSIEAMKKVESIKQKRQNAHIMQRLIKGREIEQEIDVKEVQRNMSLIRSPAAGLKQRRALEERESQMESEDMMERNVDQRRREEEMQDDDMQMAAEEVMLAN